MKNRLLTSISSLVPLFALLSACSSAPKYNSPDEWIAESKAGQQLPLGRGANEWSEAKNFNLGSNTIAVKSKFLKQHGSTCHFDVQYTNVGKAYVDTTSALTTPEKLNIYTHNSYRVRLDPGKSVTVADLEMRECGALIFGTSEGLGNCASCKPWVQFNFK
jgi:hypothetical protein